MRRKVKRVIDGDTFEVYQKVNGARFIRLSGVSAPERYNKGGLKATNTLRRLISGKTVTLVPKGRSYGRVVADIRQKRKSVNKRSKQILVHSKDITQNSF